MLNNMIQVIKSIFNQTTYASDLEAYIESRRPQSAADIERYTREYNKQISQGGWI